MYYLNLVPDKTLQDLAIVPALSLRERGSLVGVNVESTGFFRPSIRTTCLPVIAIDNGGCDDENDESKC